MIYSIHIYSAWHKCRHMQYLSCLGNKFFEYLGAYLWEYHIITKISLLGLFYIFWGITELHLFIPFLNAIPGAPGWHSQLSVRLQLRSWSRGSWVWALRQALCWQLRGGSLLQILCLPLCPSPHWPSISLSFSLKNKH